ncbi:restriction endonuclease subunit S [Vibrio breoganii]|uniref:restriction endonuclease subunit S n=1 Tax=Vibrio breoganii TaxID=553239 RepID=UPI000C860B48|nr:restriction endonuclease subunit S [Vibrio breoganii]
MTEKMNVPKLRFDEFSKSWELVSLGKLMDFKNGINASKEQYGSGVKFINVMDIIENDYITHDRIVGLVDIQEKEFEKNIVEYGDILFQRSSETREEVGQANVYLDESKAATFGGFVIRGKKVSEFDSVCMNYLLKTSKARKEVTTKSGGSTRYNVGQATLSAVNIDLPPTLPEQQKIASFLSKVDEKIGLLTEKKDKLTEYKKGVMQQLFNGKWENQGGQLTFIPPTLRFKADDGSEFPDWEEKKLGDLCSITTGKLDANAMVENGEYRFYTCAKEHYQIDKYAFDTEALLISGNGANVGYIHYYNGKFNAYQRTYVLDGFNTSYIHYVKCFLDRNLRKRIMQEKNEGNTPYIVLSTLKDMTIQLPRKQEQTKIANFLSAIDQKIDLANSELDKAKKWKKGLLQQMFV